MKSISTAILLALLATSLRANDLKTDENMHMTNCTFYVMASSPTKHVDLRANIASSSNADGFAEIGGASSIPADQDYKEFFRAMGVQWPEGSYISYVPVIGKLHVYNTIDNVAKLAQVMTPVLVPPPEVDIRVQFVEFKLADLDPLARQGLISEADLKRLWQQGKGKLLHAPKIVTQVDKEATFKDVNQCIYPTTFADSRTTASTNNRALPLRDKVLTSGAFKTRETGMIMSAVPYVWRNGNTIGLELTVQIIGDPAWKDYGFDWADTDGRKHHIPIKQPFFHSYMISTDINLKPETPVLLGGGMPSGEKERIMYAFATANLVDTNAQAAEIFGRGGSQAFQADRPAQMIDRIYNVYDEFDRTMEDFCEDVFLDRDSVKKDVLSDKELLWIKALRQSGIQWPEGSFIKHDPAMGRLYVRNTQENMKSFENVLVSFSTSFSNVEMELQFVEFEMTDINSMTANGVTPDTQSLKTLWQEGKAKLICAPRVMGGWGMESTVKSVTEYIYPTNFTIVTIETNNSDNALVHASGLVPLSFETREAGVMLDVLFCPHPPEINITMMAELVHEPVWKDYGNDSLDPLGNKQHTYMEQPLFDSQLTSTGLAPGNGATVLLGGGMTRKDPSKVVYAFVVARFVDMEGKPLGTR